MQFFLHWVDIGSSEASWKAVAVWNPAFAVSDEEVISMKIDHEEGQVPSMNVMVANPKVGLLSPSRKIWAWMSVNHKSVTYPLFFGRLVGIPTDILGEAITLQFTGRHKDFVTKKQIAAEKLKVRPFYDPVFITEDRRDDPDAILEGYSALWHIDRTTLEVSPSDVLVGEDGLAVFLPSEVPYDSVRMSLQQSPLIAVSVKADVSWTQEFKGYLDTGFGSIKTYTGDGIMGDWPQPSSSLGGGWTAVSSFIKDVWRISTTQNLQYTTGFQNTQKNQNDGDVVSFSASYDYPNFSSRVEYIFREMTRKTVLGFMDKGTVDLYGNDSPTNIPSSIDWTAAYVPVWKLKYRLGLRYDASRSRTERIEFVLKGDTQPILADATVTEDTDSIEMTGSDVGQPIINFVNWTSIAGAFVDIGTFIFPDNPLVAGQKSIQVCITSGVSGTVIPTFSNVAGETTADGTVTWASLGYSTGIYNITTDWSRQTQIPLGEIILPHVPFSIPYKDFVSPGRMQTPEVGVSVDKYFIVEVPNRGFFQCTLNGTTDNDNPKWKTDGSITKDGTAEWTFIGTALPSGVDYYICTNAGITGEALPYFGSGETLINDGPVVWTKVPVAEVPIGGAPGMISRNDYFPTDRGCWSIEYLMCLARARLRMRSRAVEVSFKCSFERAMALSCRMSAQLYDHRLPGGVATGKVVSYSLEADGDKKLIIGSVKIGCAVGRSNTLSIVYGEPSYCDDDYVEYAYQTHEGQVSGAGDDMGYTPPQSNVADKFTFPLTEDQVFLNGGFVHRGSLSKQAQGIRDALEKAWLAQHYTAVTNISNVGEALQAQYLTNQASYNSVESKLAQNPIWIELELKPVSGLAYENFYSLTVTDLMLPKMIDLEATTVVTPPSAGSIVYASAAFTGVGNREIDGDIPFGHAGITMPGNGIMSLDPAFNRAARIGMSVAGGLAASTLQHHAAYLTTAGEGSFTVRNSRTNLWAVAVFNTAGSGTLQCDATVQVLGGIYGNALMSGEGSVVTAATMEHTASADMAGSGEMALVPSNYVGAALSGDGEQSSSATILSAARATLSGSSSLTAVSNDVQDGAVFAGSGSMVVDAVLPSAVTSARYWRLFIDSPANGIGDYSELTEFEMFESIGGSNVATGGTPFESSHFGGAIVDHIFDGVKPGGDVWISGGSGTQYVGYDFGAGNDKAIVAIGLSIAGSTGRAPGNFHMEYSSDGSTWNSADWVVTGQIDWTGSQTRTYYKPTGPSDAKRMWRLYVTDTVSSGDYVQIAELTFKVGGSAPTAHGFVMAGSGYFGTAWPSFAFDGSTGGTNWISPNSTKPHWIGYDYGVGNDVDSITITATDGNRAPKDFDIQYSQDGSSWTTEWSVTGATWGSSTQTFNNNNIKASALLQGAGSTVVDATLPSTITSARYWRLNVSAVNGGGYTELTELGWITSYDGVVIPASGGAVISSSAYGGLVADRLYDNNYDTVWTSADTSSPQWAGYDFGSSMPIAGVRLTGPTSGWAARAPKDFTIEYSDNGSSWTVLFSVTDQTSWGNIERRQFIDPSVAAPSPNPRLTPSRYWRVKLHSINSADYADFADLAWIINSSRDTVPSTGGSVIESSSYSGLGASRLFDSDPATNWTSGGTVLPHWVGYDFGSSNPQVIVGISMTGPVAYWVARAPKDFTIEYSKNGTDWAVAWSVTNQTGWSGGETREFMDPAI